MNDTKRELMTVRAVLEGRAVNECIQSVVASATASDVAGVNTAILQHAQDFAWWSTLEAHAVLALDDAKGALAGFEANFVSTADAKMRMTQIKAVMRTSADWKTLHDLVRVAEKQLALIRVGRKTCEENKSALSEVARNLRAEMERLTNVTTTGGTRATDRAEQRQQAAYGRK